MFVFANFLLHFFCQTFLWALLFGLIQIHILMSWERFVAPFWFLLNLISKVLRYLLKVHVLRRLQSFHYLFVLLGRIFSSSLFSSFLKTLTIHSNHNTIYLSFHFLVPKLNSLSGNFFASTSCCCNRPALFSVILTLYCLTKVWAAQARQRLAACGTKYQK